MPKYYNTPEFKALSQEWQQKLKAEGFSDIENTTPKAQRPSEYSLRAEFRSNIRSGQPRREFVSTQNARRLRDFFAKLDGYLSDSTTKLPPVDRLMLELWSQGRHIVDIAQECQCNERTVRRRLARYKKIVLAL